MPISFANPWFFLLLLFLIPMFFYYRRTKVSIGYSSVEHFVKVKKASSSYLIHLSFLLKVLVFILLVIAIARPQIGRTKTERKTEGLDMMLVIDTSGSMKAVDLKIQGKRRDRLYVIKSVVSDFIEKRTDDRLGMVVFGTHAYAQSPLTLDHDVLRQYLDAVEIGMAGEATAIGDAIGLAINSIKDLKSKNKVIILLTDGANTAGKIDPIQVTGAAKELGIKIYTVGVGSDGLVPVPTPFGLQNVRMKLDEDLLRKMAQETGGQYFKAQDTGTLVKVYETIDKLEKSEVKVTSYHNYEEQYAAFLWWGFYLLMAELLVSASRFRRIP